MSSFWTLFCSLVYRAAIVDGIAIARVVRVIAVGWLLVEFVGFFYVLVCSSYFVVRCRLDDASCRGS